MQKFDKKYLKILKCPSSGEDLFYDEKKNILYMGDDNPDIKPLKVVGISSCPKDASVDVKSICDYVSHKKGGYGCVRDVIEQVMRIHGKWI